MALPFCTPYRKLPSLNSHHQDALICARQSRKQQHPFEGRSVCPKLKFEIIIFLQNDDAQEKEFARTGLLRFGNAVYGQGMGKEGHYAICKFAEQLLSKAAAAAVNDLVPEDLASWCSWADEQRFRYHWSRPSHFINTPDNKCTYQYSGDCYDEYGDKGRCLEAAVNNYTSQLQTYGTNSAEQYDYFSSRLPILEKQLAKEGVRLAGTLNRLFK